MDTTKRQSPKNFNNVNDSLDANANQNEIGVKTTTLYGLHEEWVRIDGKVVKGDRNVAKQSVVCRLRPLVADYT